MQSQLQYNNSAYSVKITDQKDLVDSKTHGNPLYLLKSLEILIKGSLSPKPRCSWK